MLMPSNGRGLGPRVDESTLAYWHLDDASATVAADMVLNLRPLGQVGAIPTPALETARVGRGRSFTGAQLLGRAATAADLAFAQGEWTVSVWVRAMAMPALPGDSLVVCALGGRDGVDGGVADDNVQFSLDLVRDPSVVPYPGANGEVRPRLFFEDGLGSDHALLVTGVDWRRMLGRWTLLTWRKRVGAPYTYDCLVNGRQVQSFAAQPSSSGAVVTDQRWTVGGAVDAAGTGVARGMTGGVCAWHAQRGVLSDAEVESMWRMGAGLDLPTSTHARLFVADFGGTMRDLTDPAVLGDDFLESVEFVDGIDDQCQQATATLFRESGDLSLAPLRGDSLLNNPTLSPTYNALLEVWRACRLEVARVPCWTAPTAADWVSRFEGRVDEVDDGGERVQLSMRDEGCRMAERYVDQERSYPAPGDLNTNGCGPTAGGRETVLQRVIDDNGGAPAFGAFAALHVPIPTQSCMVPMQQPLPRGHLLPSLRTLAGHIGWDCRSRFDPSAAAHRLTMFDPGRGRVDCDAVLDPRDVVKVSTGRTDASNVRNNITVTFPDRLSAGVPSDQGLANPNSVNVQDATSIARYDDRRMEAIEDQSSQIDTPTEAGRMAGAILADLAYPLREVQTELAAVPELESHDLCVLRPDGLRATLNQEAAVRQVRHAFRAGECTTTIGAQGKPAAGYNRWLSIEAGRNGRPPIRNPGEALTGRGVGTLLPGLLDMVERSVYLGGTKFVEIKNGDFARFTRGNAFPPDAWEVTGGAWGTNLVAVENVTLSGGRAVLMTAAASALRCQLVPILGSVDTPYSFEVHWQWPTPPALPGAPKRVELLIEWVAADRSTVVATAVRRPGGLAPPYQMPDVPGVVGNTWFTSRVDGICPIDDAAGLVSTARFVRITVRPDTDGAHAMPGGGVLVDTIAIYRTAREARTFCLNPWALGGGAPVNVWYNVALRGVGAAPVFRTHDWGHNEFVGVAGPSTIIPREDGSNEVVAAAFLGNGFLAKEPGTFLITSSVALHVNSVAPVAALAPMARVVRNASYTSLAQPDNTGGVVVARANGGTWVPAGTFDPALPGLGFGGSVSVVQIAGRAELQKDDRLTLEFYRADLGGFTVVQLAAVGTSPENTTWWNVRMGLAE